MPIHIDEHLLTLADASRLIPGRNGRRVHKSALYRWTNTGCRGVILESTQCGGTRCTSREALDRFFSRLSAASLKIGTASSEASRDTGTQGHLAAVEDQLDQLGI
ncbi:MAG: DUF1580 domain-containing protein [Candidatus Nealsonbacteria bacterium]|nr:DUF1580 domain-containing protein [Candidatus Nealsonbacteria bacterium]